MATNAQTRPAGGLAARLALLRSPVVRVALLIAPAGYGKTTTANALRKEYANSGVCDCEVRGLAEFSRNVLAALTEENPAESAFFKGLQAELATVADNAAECRNLLNAGWNKNAASSLFTFENAELIAADPVVTSAFIELLNTAPPNRKMLVCSRAPLPARASRYLPPHRISKLMTVDFTMSESEAAEILEKQGIPQPYWSRIIDVARGWPVVLLLLARFYHEGRLEAALSDAKHVQFEDLFVYFIHEVLAPLEPAVKNVMSLCSFVPGITADELSVATGQTPLQLQETLRKSLLVQRDGSGFTIHPLVREVVLQTEGNPTIPISIARYAEQRGDFLRAALVYRLAGNDDDAARAMARLSMQDLQTSESAYELTQLPLVSLRAYPKLVAVAKELRSDITEELLRDLFEGLSAVDDAEAVVTVAQAYSEHLELEQGLAVIESPLVRRAAEASPRAAMLLAGWVEMLNVMYWKLSSVHDRLREAYARLDQAGLRMHSARIAHCLHNALRWRGDREGSLHWHKVCLGVSRHCGPRLHAQYLLLGFANAWFWGDQQAAKECYEEMEAAASATHHPDYAWVLRALQADSLDSVVPLWNFALTLRQLLIAAAKAEPRQRDALIERGIQYSRQFRPIQTPAPFFSLARAAADPSNRRQVCEALLAGQDLDGAPELRVAIRSYANGVPSFLDSFTSRFEPRQSSVTRPAALSLRLELLNERITINGELIKLTAREAAVLAFLSRRRIATPREEIQDALWPELDETGARDALYSLLHRLRKRTNHADIVQGIGNAYRLSERVQVDLWDLEFIAQQLQRGEGVDASIDLALLYSRVQEREYPHLRQYEWFAAIDYRVHENARVLARQLIGAAKKAGDDAAIMRYAADLIDEDACDEWAHETLIRLHLEKHNRAEAARVYRTYCQLLQQQIGAPPSAEMRQLARSLDI